MTLTAEDAGRDDQSRRNLAVRVGVSVLLVAALAYAVVWLLVVEGGGFEDGRRAILWVWGFAVLLLVVFFGHALVESWKAGS